MLGSDQSTGLWSACCKLKCASGVLQASVLPFSATSQHGAPSSSIPAEPSHSAPSMGGGHAALAERGAAEGGGRNALCGRQPLSTTLSRHGEARDRGACAPYLVRGHRVASQRRAIVRDEGLHALVARKRAVQVGGGVLDGVAAQRAVEG